MLNYAELVAISIALAVDAATYAFSYGLGLRQGRAKAALALAAVVGSFQAGMPLLGYVAGAGLRSAVQSWGGWIGLAIFCALGGSVLYKTWCKPEDTAEPAAAAPLGLGGLLLVGLATSMDAFAVGICMAVGHLFGEGLSGEQLWVAAAVIGLVTFAGAMCCFHIARLLHHLPERLLQTLAGLILIALGIWQVC